MPDPTVRPLLQRILTNQQGHIAQSRSNGAAAKVAATQSGVAATQAGQARQAIATVGANLQRAWQAARIDKVLNALNTFLLIHNAALLSGSLVQTLGEISSQSLAVFGIKDEQGAPIDVNQILGQTVSNFVKGIVGEQVYNGVATTWNKANRIISTASQIVWSIREISDTTHELLEWGAENTGRIGNALKKYRIVGEDAYKAMPEKINPTTARRRKFQRVFDGLENLDEAASSFGQVTSNVLSIQQEFTETVEATTRLKQEFESEPPRPQIENQPVATAAAESRASSSSPSIAPADREKGDSQ